MFPIGENQNGPLGIDNHCPMGNHEGMKTLHDWLSEARGRTKALADHLRLPSSMVSKMASGDKQIPLDHCPFIEAFTGGEVPCEVQRPDKVEYFAMLRSREAAAQAEPVTQAGAL